MRSVFVAVGLLAAACAAPRAAAEGEEGPAPRGLQTATDLKFQDVPVPYDFRYDDAKSTVMEAGSFRSGVLVYHGSASPAELIAYYLQEMTKYDWRPIAKVEDRGRTTLSFEKPGLVSYVEITSGLGRSATVKITYVPKGVGGGS